MPIHPLHNGVSIHGLLFELPYIPLQRWVGLRPPKPEPRIRRSEDHFFFLAAARFSLYAIATACFTGFPAFTSVFIFFLNALGDFDLTSGMSFPFRFYRRRVGLDRRCLLFHRRGFSFDSSTFGLGGKRPNTHKVPSF